jgi:hypothetical protein
MAHDRDFRGITRRALLVASMAAALAGIDAHAQTGSAGAHDVAIHVDILGIAQLDVDPQAAVDFADATVPTSQQDSLPSMDIGDPLGLIHLSTGEVVAEAEYRPGVSLSAVGADARVEQLDLSAVSLLGDSLLSITANVVQSGSQVFGYCLPAGRRPANDIDDITFFNGFDTGNITTGGPPGSGAPGNDVVLDDLQIKILGISVPNLPSNPPANTSIDLAALGIANASLVLNEQTTSGDGVTSGGLATNALHLSLDAVGGLISADVEIAHGDTLLACPD